MTTNDLIADLPGETLIREGLADFSSGRWTVAAYLVAIARVRLVKAGLIADSERHQIGDPELQLYRLLQKQGGDAYSRYNSLVRELVSFEQALDHRFRRRSEREGRSG